jgi:hypothetical protein
LPDYKGNGRKRLEDMMNDLSHRQVLDSVIIAQREHLVEEHGMNPDDAEDLAFRRVADAVYTQGELFPFEGDVLWERKENADANTEDKGDCQ